MKPLKSMRLHLNSAQRSRTMQDCLKMKTIKWHETITREYKMFTESLIEVQLYTQ